MRNTALNQVGMLGQAIWLDYVRKDLIVDGALGRLIAEDELKGLTSNPSIFEKAIVEGGFYTESIRRLKPSHADPKALYEQLSQSDLRDAADAFRPLYDRTGGRDGFVSLEVDPRLAHDRAGTVAEAKRLWTELDRPNSFIKVPATDEGVVAIRELVAEGVNVNATLLFSPSRVREVAVAYLDGVEARLAQGGQVRHLASVASFFVSRIDVAIDPLLKKIVATGGPAGEIACKVEGLCAIASAKMAYQVYREVFSSERFRLLEGRGARAQKLVWASTGMKDPACSDVKYVEALIGAETINTLPLRTLDAFRDHGTAKAWLERDIEDACWTLDQLPGLGIQIGAIEKELEAQGVAGFTRAFEGILKALA